MMKFLVKSFLCSLIVIAVVGCSSMPPTFVSESMRLRGKVYRMGVQDSFDAVEAAAAKLSWEVLVSDRKSRYILIKPPSSVTRSSIGNRARGGNRLEVEVIPIDSTRTKIRSRMDIKQMVDYGNIANRLDEFYSALDLVVNEES